MVSLLLKLFILYHDLLQVKSQRCPVTSQSRFEDLLILRDIVECNRDSHMSSRRDTTITMFG